MRELATSTAAAIRLLALSIAPCSGPYTAELAAEATFSALALAAEYAYSAFSLATDEIEL